VYEMYVDTAIKWGIDALFTPEAERLFRSRFEQTLGRDKTDRILAWHRSSRSAR